MKKITVFILISVFLTGCTQSLDVIKQPNPTKTEKISSQITTQNTPFVVTTVDASIKQYTSNTSGLRFKYPATWFLNGLDIGDEKAPHLFIDEAYDMNAMNTVCGELGGCQQDAKKLQQSIENATAPGIIFFQGGKGSLSVTCSGNEGYDLVPSPMYKFTFYHDNKVYTMRLNDLSHRLSTSGICSQLPYILKIKVPDVINQTGYKPYNDFVSAIHNTLILQ